MWQVKKTNPTENFAEQYLWDSRDEELAETLKKNHSLRSHLHNTSDPKFKWDTYLVHYLDLVQLNEPIITIVFLEHLSYHLSDLVFILYLFCEMRRFLIYR